MALILLFIPFYNVTKFKLEQRIYWFSYICTCLMTIVAINSNSPDSFSFYWTTVYIQLGTLSLQPFMYYYLKGTFKIQEQE